MTDENNLMSDAELDRLLAAASTPKIPSDFNARLAARLRNGGLGDNVIPFPKKLQPKPRQRVLLPMAAALAASLALGLWLGTSEQMSNLISAGSDVVALDTSSDAVPTGLDDLLTANEDNQS